MNTPEVLETVAVRQQGQQITMREASDMLSNYFRLNGVSRSAVIGANCLESLLSQKSANGVRLHFGQNADGHTSLVIVAVDKAGNDILPINAEVGDTGSIFDHVLLCPPFCGDKDIIKLYPTASDYRPSNSII